MAHQLALQWTRHLPDDGSDTKDNFRAYLLAANTIFERLDEILSEMTKESVKADYDKAAWAYYAADQAGYNRALKEIRHLLPLTSE